VKTAVINRFLGKEIFKNDDRDQTTRVADLTKLTDMKIGDIGGVLAMCSVRKRSKVL